MNEKLDAVKDLYNAIQKIQTSGISMKDVIDIITIIDPTIVESFHLNNLIMSNDVATSRSSTKSIKKDNVKTNIPEKKKNTIVKEEQNKKSTKKHIRLTDEQIHHLCEHLAKTSFTFNHEDVQKLYNISYSTLYRILYKKSYTNISDKYFTLVDGKPVSLIPTDNEKKTICTDALNEEDGNIKRAFDNIFTKDPKTKITIFDVFNTKFEISRITDDDMMDLIKTIMIAYNYDIGVIQAEMLDKCDIVLTASHMKFIRQAAMKAGKIAIEPLPKTASDHDPKIERENEILNVLKRLNFDLLQTFLHMRTTPYPVTMIDIYRVKAKYGMIEKYDIATVCVNMYRSGGIHDVEKISKIIEDQLYIKLKPSKIETYISQYNAKIPFEKRTF